MPIKLVNKTAVGEVRHLQALGTISRYLSGPWHCDLPVSCPHLSPMGCKADEQKHKCGEHSPLSSLSLCSLSPYFTFTEKNVDFLFLGSVSQTGFPEILLVQEVSKCNIREGPGGQ